MSGLLWIAVAGLCVALVWLQFLGARTLREWGVESPAPVATLRTVNTVAVIALVAYAFIEWVR